MIEEPDIGVLGDSAGCCWMLRGRTEGDDDTGTRPSGHGKIPSLCHVLVASGADPEM